MTLNPKEAESLIEKIKEVLEGHKEILLAYIFGSYVHSTFGNL